MTSVDVAAILTSLEGAVSNALHGLTLTPDFVNRPSDPTTNVDAVIDERLRQLLHDIIPCNYVSEESSPTIEGLSDLAWVVDPIDGTHNLVAGTPEFGVSVALVAVSSLRPLVAHCEMPRMGLRYAAAIQVGAF